MDRITTTDTSIMDMDTVAMGKLDVYMLPIDCRITFDYHFLKNHHKTVPKLKRNQE